MLSATSSRIAPDVPGSEAGRYRPAAAVIWRRRAGCTILRAPPALRGDRSPRCVPRRARRCGRRCARWTGDARSRWWLRSLICSSRAKRTACSFTRRDARSPREDEHRRILEERARDIATRGAGRPRAAPPARRPGSPGRPGAPRRTRPATPGAPASSISASVASGFARRMLERSDLVEQVGVLRDQRDAIAQVVEPVLPQVVPVEPDDPRPRVPEPHQQVRRWSCPPPTARRAPTSCPPAR